MFKLLKLFFFVGLVTVGLYFWGDFRINDVNVRDYLRSKVSLQEVDSFKTKATRYVEALDKISEALEEAGRDTNSQGSSSSAATLSNALNQLKKGQSGDVLDQLSYDNISAKDRKELRKLLKNSLNLEVKK